MKVVVVGPFNDFLDAYHGLQRAGHTVVLGRPHEDYTPYSETELIQLCGDANALQGSHRDVITRKVLEAAPQLRLVVYPFIGVDRVDLRAATELGILVCNSPSRENVVGMAEATVGLMLALVKRMKHNEAVLRRGGWSRPEDRGGLLAGKTVGIVGLGRIGQAVAERLAAWGARLLGYDPYVSREKAAELQVSMVDLESLLSESDFVTVQVVLTSETRHMIGAEQLRLMKPTAFLLNTSRGEAIDEEALAKAVEAEWIAGAALDVFEREPLPPDSPLRRLDSERVILTPHNIGHSDAAMRGNLRLTVDSLLAGLEGKIPGTVVNRDAIPRWTERLAAGRTARQLTNAEVHNDGG
jgi:D-3-phosphoglycerate dehydrogenase